MARVCELCGRGPQFGHRISHAHNVTKRRWNLNLQTVRAIVNGASRRLRVCTSCIRSGKVQKVAQAPYRQSVTTKEHPSRHDCEIAEIRALMGKMAKGTLALQDDMRKAGAAIAATQKKYGIWLPPRSAPKLL